MCSRSGMTMCSFCLEASFGHMWTCIYLRLHLSRPFIFMFTSCYTAVRSLDKSRFYPLGCCRGLPPVRFETCKVANKWEPMCSDVCMTCRSLRYRGAGCPARGGASTEAEHPALRRGIAYRARTLCSRTEHYVPGWNVVFQTERCVPDGTL